MMGGMLVTSSALPTATAPRVAIDPRLVLSLAALYVIWSSTYFAIRIAIAELPSLLSASLRFVAAGAVMLAIARRRGATWPASRDWRAVLPSALLLFLGGNGFVVLAERSVSSGGAAVVCATMPLWVGVLSWLAGQRPTAREWTSLVVGFAGVIVLAGGPTLDGEPLHVALLVASPICWALGSILTRRVPAALRGDTFLLSGMQMLMGGVILGISGAAIGERFPTDASASAWLALAYLFVAGSLLGFTAYNWLLRNARPVVATSYAYVNPILAVLLGAAFGGEALGLSTLVANVLIVSAIMLALVRPRR